jgi:hypothetical protein
MSTQPAGAATASRDPWRDVDAWLRTSDAHQFVDDAVLGCLPTYEADELLTDYGIPADQDTRRRLARMIDAALTAGEV